MYRAKLLYPLMVAGLLACSSSAYSAVTTFYNFGTLLATDCPTAPNTFQANPFAGLAATDTGNGVWDFKLTINNNLFSSFGNNSFIGSMSFDFNPDPLASKPATTFIGSNLGGVTSVFSTTGTGLSGLPDIDFGTQFGLGANNRLSQNDWVEWTVSGLGIGSSLVNMYVKVQNIGGNFCSSSTCSAKYTPLISAVPEPETYAMLLTGLGLIGFSIRRRKN
jgi:hypothetical protein